MTMVPGTNSQRKWSQPLRPVRSAGVQKCVELRKESGKSVSADPDRQKRERARGEIIKETSFRFKIGI